MSTIDRRDFIRSSVALGAGAAAAGRWPAATVAQTAQGTGVPLIVTSHTNETGHDAMRQAWDILSSGGSAMDAVEKGANVNLQDKLGRTALIIAATEGQEAIVKLLLENGADKKLANTSGRTARDIAEREGFTSIANLLQ